jgi:NADPH:quinone reductase-like Zn-dependent oxidoreductase
LVSRYCEDYPMNETFPIKSLQLSSLVEPVGPLDGPGGPAEGPGGRVVMFLEEVEVAPPGDDEVIVRVEAAPINPSDLGLALAGADISAAVSEGTPIRPVLSAPIAAAAMRSVGGRLGMALPVGNEGAGTVVAAGSSDAAHALLNKTVAVAGGAMYTQYRRVKASACAELPEGTSAVEGASSFVNPMTVLGMLETMRMEGHTAIVHTAAASNLGQMLNRVCIDEGIPLVNVVRRPEQQDLLRDAGARYVCSTASDTFTADLTEAISATSATLAFDAVGGGRLAGQILAAMEAAAVAKMPAYSRYGSDTHKQVYIYGSLDRGPTELHRSFGMSWGVGGWLLTPLLAKVGPATVEAMRRKVTSNLKTLFASSYTREVSLAGALSLEAVKDYARQGTGSKYLIRPHLA